MKEKEKVRLIHGFGFLALALMLMFAVYPVRAQAASYKTITRYADKKGRTAGKTVFSWKSNSKVLYATTNGKKVKLYSAPTGYIISPSVVSNGSDVYFAAYKKDGSKPVFYRSTVAGKNRKKIATGSDLEWGWSQLAGYYKNKLYFVGGLEWMGEYIYSLNVKTGKFKQVLHADICKGETCQIGQSGKYLVYSGYYQICTYNIATGETETILWKSNHADIIDGSYVYVAQKEWIETGSGSGYSVLSVTRCKVDGSKNKTLVKNIKINASKSVTLTSNSVTYYDVNGKKKTKKF